MRLIIIKPILTFLEVFIVVSKRIPKIFISPIDSKLTTVKQLVSGENLLNNRYGYEN